MLKQHWLVNIVMLLLLSAQYVQAQKISGVESFLIELRNLKSTKDTGLVSKVIVKLSNTPEDVLIKQEVWLEIEKLKGFLSDQSYNNLSGAYITRLLALKTTAAYDRVIELGNSFLDKILKAKTDNQYYTGLFLFRELRVAYRNLGRFNESLNYYGSAEKVFLQLNDSNAVSIANNVLSGLYFRMGMQERAIYHQGKSVAYLNEEQLDVRDNPAKNLLGISGKLNRFAVLASYYLNDNKIPEADSCIQKAMYYYSKLNFPLLNLDVPYMFLQQARIKSLSGVSDSQQAFNQCLNYQLIYRSPPFAFAVYYQEKAIDLIRLGYLDSATYYVKEIHKLIDSFKIGLTNPWGDLIPEFIEAKIAMKKGDYRFAIKLLKIELQKLQVFSLRNTQIQVFELLAEAYNSIGDHKSAYKSIKEAINLKNAVTQDEKDARTVSFETERKIQDNETAIMLLNARDEANKKTRVFLFGIIGLLGLLAVALLFFYRNKQKTSKELESKNQKLEQTLNQLKATQSQLVQSEKMASLGELTAGIAHEIQNPLNFVNNFSEVSNELIDEMKVELDKGEIEEAKTIASDIQQNLSKIAHHGKRADAIVKGMLQHSRSGTGQKELTDLNVLCEEYLRLSYHGLRAKDSSFNAAFETHFDTTVGAIKIVPQEIGRVLLNLLNNAFYAVNEKSRKGIAGYAPKVVVRTEKLGDSVKIEVEDNGMGIPNSILEKIFQPFFTTKPTGQGTGLGLSLSYDIVKAHGGELTANSQVGEGTVFKIILPKV